MNCFNNGPLRAKLILAFQEVLKWVWPPINRYLMSIYKVTFGCQLGWYKMPLQCSRAQLLCHPPNMTWCDVTWNLCPLLYPCTRATQCQCVTWLKLNIRHITSIAHKSSIIITLTTTTYISLHSHVALAVTSHQYYNTKTFDTNYRSTH